MPTSTSTTTTRQDLKQSQRGLGNLSKISANSKKTEAGPGLGWNILNEDVSLPAAAINVHALRNNLDWMQDFANTHGVLFAPHGKTTMSPALFNIQRECGAWGMSLASATAVELAWRFGFSRILMVNQLVGRRNMEILAEVLAKDVDFEFACLVDSVRNVAALGEFFKTRGQTLRVLLEIGVSGDRGRAGVRTISDELKVVREIQRWGGTLSLVGVEVYEGVLDEEEEVRELLTHVAERTRVLLGRKVFGETPIIISGGGSSWFDLVTEEFTKLVREGLPVQVVLRPGCYLTHDVGHYHKAMLRMNKTMQRSGSGSAELLGRESKLKPCLQIWTYVQSVPQPGYAIVTFGRKDASETAGFPVPALHFRPLTQTKNSEILIEEQEEIAKPKQVGSKGWRIIKMMDQHATLRFGEDDEIRVGDMIAFDICHPCTTTNKWKHILLIDDAANVVDIVQTYF